MNGIRRALLLIGLTAAVIIGASIPASATFADSVRIPASIATLDVTAPKSVSTGGTKCVTWQTWNSWTGTWETHSELQAKVSWTASTTPRGVTGYVISAVFADGTKYPVGVVGPTTTSISGDYPIQYASANIRVTVTTMTSFGWYEESAPSGPIRC
jgi:hypothetical protein